MFKSRIEIDSRFGRSLVTTETVHKGDIVVDELPFAWGPKQNSGIVCLGCYRDLQFGEDGDSVDRCPTCDWPLCSACEDSIDHQGECTIFSGANVRFAGNVGEDGICAQLDCITPLRVLLAKEANPERWDKEVAPMEYHDKERRENTDIWHADLVNIAQYLRGPCKLGDRFSEDLIIVLLAKEANPERWDKEVAPMEYHDKERRESTDIWHADLVNIAQYLRGPCKLGDRFSEDLIMQVVGLLEVNAFEAKSLMGHPLRALYPITGILSHNCVPNTMRSIYPSEDYRIRLRAMVDLEPGQQLQHSYSYTLDGTTQRQQHLKTGKFFTCDCKRCKDPTELGTNFSTFKCSKCEDGWLIWTNPLDPLTEWKCTICEFKTSNNAVHKAVSIMQAEVAELQAMEMGAERLQETEKLLKKYRSVLHPLHFLKISLNQNLIEMYGRVGGYEMVDLPDILLERKEELCRQVLRVMNVFEPGLSRSRAMILYELHVPVVLQAKSGFIAGVLTGERLKDKLLEATTILKECVDILQHEDAQSQEGVLGLIAKQAMEQLTQSIEGLGGE